MSPNLKEIVFWINNEGNVTVSDPSIELMTLFKALGNELQIKKARLPFLELSPRFLKSKRSKLPINSKRLRTLPTINLWLFHKHFRFKDYESDNKKCISYLELKAELLRRIMNSCILCERMCKVNRLKGERGFCNVGSEARITREFIHIGEEHDLIPSHTIFFPGCNMKCVFCPELMRNHEPSKWEKLSPLDLAAIITRRFREGAVNINFVGGEPTLYLFAIIETLRMSSIPPLPIVWNSNMYYSKETSEILDGLVDIYLGDFKFGNNTCAQRLSNAFNYWETVTRNFRSAKKQGARVIVRHLPIPGHFECCTRPIMNWIKQELKGATVSILEFQSAG